MAALSTPLCMVCKEQFNAERPVMMLVGCTCSERMCKICSDILFKKDSVEALCPNCRVPITKVATDLFLAGAFGYSVTADVHEVAHQVIAASSTPLFQKAMRLKKQKMMGQAEKYFEEAAQMGNADAYYILGIWYHASMDIATYTTGIEYLQKAADLGNTRAMHQLFCIYKDGNKTPKDLVSAAHYLQKAASKGHTKSIYRLGEFYIKGNVFGQNIDLGLSLIKQAAEAGNAMAQFQLGCIYGNRFQHSYFLGSCSKNVKKALQNFYNEQEAVKYFELSASKFKLAFLILADECRRSDRFFPSLLPIERYHLGQSYCSQAKKHKLSPNELRMLTNIERALKNSITKLQPPPSAPQLEVLEPLLQPTTNSCAIM